MSSMLQDDHADNQRGIVSTNSINWDKFNEDLFSISFFCEKKSFLKYMNQSLETLKMMLEKINLQKLKKECG